VLEIFATGCLGRSAVTAEAFFISKMSYVAGKGEEKGYDSVQAKSHKIRITLTSKNVKNLEKGRSQSYFMRFLALTLHPGNI